MCWRSAPSGVLPCHSWFGCVVGIPGIFVTFSRLAWSFDPVIAQRHGCRQTSLRPGGAHDRPRRRIPILLKEKLAEHADYMRGTGLPISSS